MGEKRHVAFWDRFGKVDRGGQSGRSTGLCHDYTSLHGIDEQNRIQINLYSMHKRYMNMQYRQISLYPENGPTIRVASSYYNLIIQHKNREQ